MSEPFVFNVETSKTIFEKRVIDLLEAAIHHVDSNTPVDDIRNQLTILATESGIINTWGQLSSNFSNIFALLQPVITKNLPLHPELGVVINSTISTSLLDLMSFDSKSHLQAVLAEQDKEFVTDALPDAPWDKHLHLSVVTPYGIVTGERALFRYYVPTPEGPQVMLSSIPMLKVGDGWVHDANIMAWRQLDEDEAVAYVTAEDERLMNIEKTAHPSHLQQLQVERWLLTADLSQYYSPEVTAHGIPVNESPVHAEVPVSEKYVERFDEIVSLASDKLSEQTEHAAIDEDVVTQPSDNTVS